MKLFKNLFLFILIVGQLGTTYVLKEGGVELARWTEDDGSDATQVIHSDEGLGEMNSEAETSFEAVEAIEEETFESDYMEEAPVIEPKKTVDDFFGEIISSEPEEDKNKPFPMNPVLNQTEEEDEFFAFDREPKAEEPLEPEQTIDDMGKEAVEEMKAFEDMLLQKSEPSELIIEEEAASAQPAEPMKEIMPEFAREVQEEMKEEEDFWKKDLWEDTRVREPIEEIEEVKKEMPVAVAPTRSSNSSEKSDGVIWEEMRKPTRYTPPAPSKPTTPARPSFSDSTTSMWPKSFQTQTAKPDGWGEGRSGYEQAMSYQGRTGQPILIYFYASSCAQCKRFDRDVLNKSETESFLDSITKVKVNINDNRDIYSKYRSRIYPAFFVQQQSGQKTPIYERTHPEFFIQEVKKALT